MNKSKAYSLLIEKGVRPSVQRIAILEYMLAHNIHPDVETVYKALCKKIPTLSVTTVYNTLKMFAQKGVVQLITVDDHKVCYDGFTTPHIHFYCNSCGKVYDIYDVAPPIISDNYLVQGHNVEQAQLYYRGVCCVCKNKA